MLRYVMTCYDVTICHAMLRYVAICYDMLRYVTTCYDMLRHVTMLLYVTLCYDMLRHVTTCYDTNDSSLWFFSAQVGPGTWPSFRPACPAAGWVCSAGRWCRPCRHTGACIPSGPRRTLSCSRDADHPTLCLDTHWRRRRRTRKERESELKLIRENLKNFRHKNITSQPSQRSSSGLLSTEYYEKRYRNCMYVYYWTTSAPSSHRTTTHSNTTLVHF